MVNKIAKGQTVRVFERYIIDYDKGIFEIDYTDFSNGPYEIIQAAPAQNGKYFDIIIQTQITAQKWIYTDKEPEKHAENWQPYDPEKEEIDEKPELLSTTKINNNDYVWSSVDDGEEEELIKELKKPEEPINAKKVFADLMNEYVEKPKEKNKKETNKIFADLMKKYDINQ